MRSARRIFGPLAVHRRPRWSEDLNGDGWNITHVATGLALAYDIPSDLVGDLVKNLVLLDWDFTHPIADLAENHRQRHCSSFQGAAGHKYGYYGYLQDVRIAREAGTLLCCGVRL